MICSLKGVQFYRVRLDAAFYRTFFIAKLKRGLPCRTLLEAMAWGGESWPERCRWNDTEGLDEDVNGMMKLDSWMQVFWIQYPSMTTVPDVDEVNNYPPIFDVSLTGICWTHSTLTVKEKSSEHEKWRHVEMYELYRLREQHLKLQPWKLTKRFIP